MLLLMVLLLLMLCSAAGRTTPDALAYTTDWRWFFSSSVLKKCTARLRRVRAFPIETAAHIKLNLEWKRTDRRYLWKRTLRTICAHENEAYEGRARVRRKRNIFHFLCVMVFFLFYFPPSLSHSLTLSPLHSFFLCGYVDWSPISP